MEDGKTIGRGAGGRHGRNQQAGRKGTGSKGTLQTYTPPQKRREQSGRTQKPRNNNNRKNFDNNRRHGGQQLKVYYSNDDDSSNGSRSFRHMHNECKALRYKVYKPQSDCSKLLRLVEHQHSNDQLTAVTLENGKIDGLVILPDTKQKYIYVCRDTPLEVFEEDPVAAETKLRREIFPKTESLEISGVDTFATSAIDETKFKLSCAACLLQAHEPNGFCLLASPSASVVDWIRDKSRSKRHEKEVAGHSLHPDHAHFVARLPRSCLWNLHRARTRAQKSSAVDEIFGHLSNQDIDAVGDPEKFTEEIELGHHLLSVLSLTSRSDEFWFVMGYDDHKSIELDLPGGKRHLGETSIEGAIRETEEETSLVWDSSWVINELQGMKRSEGCNRYFVLRPPESLLENLTGD